MKENISLFKGGKRSAGHGSFAHLVGDYDAGYYGCAVKTLYIDLVILLMASNRYSYSRVFAADMYQTVFKKDPLDPTCGDHYRRSILQPGGSREELDSLAEFLGRPPSSDAFMKELFGGCESRV